MSSAEGVVEVGGNEINERDVFYAPFTCESEPAFKIETSNTRAYCVQLVAQQNGSLGTLEHPTVCETHPRAEDADVRPFWSSKETSPLRLIRTPPVCNFCFEASKEP